MAAMGHLCCYLPAVSSLYLLHPEEAGECDKITRQKGILEVISIQVQVPSSCAVFHRTEIEVFCRQLRYRNLLNAHIGSKSIKVYMGILESTFP